MKKRTATTDDRLATAQNGQCSSDGQAPTMYDSLPAVLLGNDALMIADCSGLTARRRYRREHGQDKFAYAAQVRTRPRHGGSAADQEDAAAAETVASGAADKEQRGEKQRIGFDNPLDVDEAGVKLTLQRRERHVDHRPIDKHHAGSKNRYRQDPWRRRRCARRSAWCGANDSDIRWRR